MYTELQYYSHKRISSGQRTLKIVIRPDFIIGPDFWGVAFTQKRKHAYQAWPIMQLLDVRGSRIQWKFYFNWVTVRRDINDDQLKKKKTVYLEYFGTIVAGKVYPIGLRRHPTHLLLRLLCLERMWVGRFA